MVFGISALVLESSEGTVSGNGFLSMTLNIDLFGVPKSKTVDPYLAQTCPVVVSIIVMQPPSPVLMAYRSIDLFGNHKTKNSTAIINKYTP